MMPATLSPEVLQDDLAISLARALAAANLYAREAGINALESRISISRQDGSSGPIWRINYGPQNPVRRRGGDLVVDIDLDDASVVQALRGQ